MKPITPNYTEMGNSTGFKKRNLIRPPSSSGLVEKQYLKSFDISQTESTIASVIKNDLAAIQQEINLLDMDKKLRFSQGGLGKGYATILKKWLKEAQLNFEKEDDEFKILKFMNVDNLSAGFKKLWKLVGLLDMAISKSTQLQVITFLKYDELFTSICKDYTPVTKKLNNLNQGFSLSGFQATQIMIQRVQDLFSIVSRIRKSQKSSNLSNETEELISKLQAENSKLNSYLEKMTEELRRTTYPTNKLETKTFQVEAKVEKAALEKVFNQIKLTYNTKLDQCNNKIQLLLNEQAKLNIQIEILSKRQQMLKSDLSELKSSKRSSLSPSHSSYEQALMQELQNMKRGYETKINKLVLQYSSRQRQLKKKENQYRIENEKVKFERALLLKKYDLMK